MHNRLGQEVKGAVREAMLKMKSNITQFDATTFTQSQAELRSLISSKADKDEIEALMDIKSNKVELELIMRFCDSIHVQLLHLIVITGDLL